jgi:hypothetical protein
VSLYRDGEDSRLSGLAQVNDGLYAEVLFWCASEPIARRWIVPTCVSRLSDCKNMKSYRQSVSPNCIQLDLKYIHLLFHFHDMFRLQKSHYQVN